MKTVPLYQLIAFSIDFEGTILLQSSRTKYGTTHFAPNVVIGNTSKKLLIAFKNLAGFGYIPDRPDIQGNCSPKYRWKTSPNEIRFHLPKIEPYLVLKQRQAQLVIEGCHLLQSHTYTHEDKRRPEDHTITLLAIESEINELNMRGCGLSKLTEAELFYNHLKKK